MGGAENDMAQAGTPEVDMEEGQVRTAHAAPTQPIVPPQLRSRHHHVHAHTPLHNHHAHVHSHNAGNVDRVDTRDRLLVSAYRIRVGPPQFVRISGFRSVFLRYGEHLDDATCTFGTDVVPCRCDTLLGAVECEVPRHLSSAIVGNDDRIVVRVRIADFETSPLSFRYLSTPTDDKPKSEATYLFPRSNVHANTSFYGGDDTDGDSDDDSSDNTDDAGGKENANAGGDHRKGKRPSSRHERILSMIRRDGARKRKGRVYSLLHQCIAEFVGTMFIVIFGVGAVISAIVFDVGDLWHVTVLWGFGIAFAILVAGSISGAHLNPAVSLALALFRPKQFPFKKLLPFWLAQYLGGFIGGAINLMLFEPAIMTYEKTNNLERNSSVVTASGFGEYFPAPKAIPADQLFQSVSAGYALLIEAFGTGMLMFMILVLTDSRQRMLRHKDMFAFYIGFVIATLMTLYGPITQVGLNPARDFGPRLVAVMAGWYNVAMTGRGQGFWVYIIGPKLGAPIGAFLYDFLISPGL